MPGTPAPAKKKMMATGSYAGSTATQLQGPGSNKSLQDLQGMRQDNANVGAALRQAAPVGNQSYQDFQRTRKSPQGQADKAAYETSNKLGRLTDADYQQRRFNEGTGQLRKQAQASPGTSLFTGAPTDAAYATQRDRNVRLGNYADAGGRAVTAGTLADRSAKMDTQTGYAAPGTSLAPQAKDMGSSVLLKKKMASSPALATYAEGTRKVAKSPFSEVDNGADDGDADNAAPAAANGRYSPGFVGPPREGDTDAGLDKAAAEAKSLEPAAATTIPTTKKMALAPKGGAPANYKEAAAVLRSDKALMAQYHAGVASGKAFILNIGGKAFKYAATAKPVSSKTPGIKPPTAPTEQGWQDAYGADVASAKAALKNTAKPPVARKSMGTPTDTATTPLQLREDDENASIRKSVKKMAAR